MKKILLASTLKPLDDTRMYEKFGVSLSKFYQVIILGFGSSKPKDQANIEFESLYKGESKSYIRFLTLRNFHRKLIYHQPDIIIVHSPELLPVAGWYALFHQVKIIYDVRENYFNNIRYQPNYSLILRYILSLTVRLMEYTSNIFVSSYILAEKCYHDEFSFHKKNYQIIQNKFVLPEDLDKTSKEKSQSGFKFIYTGTISEVYGIWEAINFINQINKIEVSATLEIIGHVVSNNLLEKLNNAIRDKHYIQLQYGNPLVSHRIILEKLQKADFAILPYKPNKSTWGCIPTKMFECIALEIPMLVQQNKNWENLCNSYPAAHFVDFSKLDPYELLEELKSKKFYKNKPQREVLWKEEEKKLLAFVAES
ncbi:hypothetical protein [Chondrinema litorale]|uniref:hypothetical protein n=1 Tax=Chondrinema litorale TaxID=2994555 RepID=UPI002542923D|nr:hypothetical protein [Chondrinema litorale]UZR93783.1 hypothetical protein OQ292_18200 [Chondrinema litorale]